MLNSLASYLLGYPGSSSPAASATSPSPAADGDTSISVHVPSADSAALPGVDVRLRAIEADDDWLLVDKTDDACAEGAPSSSPAVAVPSNARLTLAVSTTSYHWPDSEDFAGAVAAGAGLGGLAAAGPLEESWFVTPPPCFTSDSVPLETSPLENLLIEHPSMSVYHRSAAPQAAATPLSSSVGASPPPRSPQRGSSASLRKLSRPAGGKQGAANKQAVAANSAAPPRTAPSSAAEAPAVERAAVAGPERSGSPSPSPAASASAVQASPRRPNAFSPYQQQQQSIQYRTAQKLVQRAACQQLKRDSLERNNKAREIRSSRNKRQRRSDHMQRHSGVNNNRKC